MKMLIEKRILKDTIKTESCWLFNGCKDSSGYGQIRINNKKTLVHRLTYELYKGPIPKGLYVCHTCDIPSCVNPAHLFLGTAKDNAVDRKQKGRNNHLKGSKHPLAKLNEILVKEIRNIKDLTCEKIALKYNVCKSTIVQIRANKIWIINE